VATRPHQSPRSGRRFSPSFQRALPWIAGVVLLAGVAAFVAVRVVHNKTGHETDAPLSSKPAVVPKKEASIKLPASARRTAQRFIETAVLRDHLRESYYLTHPVLRQGYTLAQWLTGNIPVVPFTKKYFLEARMKLDYAHRKDALLEVAMLSTNDKKFKSQYFFLELQKQGQRWLVSSWVPRAAPKVPISTA
jgi:hypothetical protein